MGIEYPVRLAVELTPVVGHTSPEVLISTPGHKIHTLLDQFDRFELSFTESSAWLEIQMINKSSTDHDMAVIINKIEFFGISDPKFIWLGQYTPEYPEPWFSQQQSTPQPVLTNVTYLGWNGTWRLDFGAPVFTWIHQVQNLGWIHT